MKLMLYLKCHPELQTVAEQVRQAQRGSSDYAALPLDDLCDTDFQDM
jgi:hypothetical protein